MIASNGVLIMSQVTVNLDPAIEQHIDRAVRRGDVGSRDGYVQQALRDRYDCDLRRQHLEDALRRGIADADAGRVTPIDEAFDKILSGLED